MLAGGLLTSCSQDNENQQNVRSLPPESNSSRDGNLSAILFWGGWKCSVVCVERYRNLMLCLRLGRPESKYNGTCRSDRR